MKKRRQEAAIILAQGEAPLLPPLPDPAWSITSLSQRLDSARPSILIIAGLMRVWDFAAIFGSALAVFFFYNVTVLGEEQQDRYPLIAMIAALSTIILMQHADCYQFHRLRDVG